MAGLQIKTKWNSSAWGKAKVFFCCHPESIEKHLDILCMDIFETHNCTVYYGEAGEAELGEMCLFVVPLTMNFLMQDCRARTFEYGFAAEHHIPILPIAMEENLNRQFKKIMNQIQPGYGDVQYLDRTSQDLTGIPYTVNRYSRQSWSQRTESSFASFFPGCRRRLTGMINRHSLMR